MALASSVAEDAGSPPGAPTDSLWWWRVSLAVPLVLCGVLSVVLAFKVEDEKAKALLLECRVTQATTAASKFQKEASRLQMELSEELGGTIKIDGHPGELSTEFSYHIFDKTTEEASVRTIKVQCPGVRHDDVRIELVF